MNSELLDKNKHDRNRFDCGIEALNNYLRLMANQQSGKDNSRTFVIVDKANPKYIVGFYTLAMTPVDLAALPKKKATKKASKFLCRRINSSVSNR